MRHAHTREAKFAKPACSYYPTWRVHTLARALSMLTLPISLSLSLSHTHGGLALSRTVGTKGEGCEGTSEHQTLCEVEPPQTVWLGHCVKYSPRKLCNHTPTPYSKYYPP